AAPAPGPRTWEGFQDWVVATAGTNGNGQSLFRGVEAEIGDDRIRLRCPSHYLMTRLSGGEGRQRAVRLLCEYFGPGTEMDLRLEAVAVPKTRDELLAQAAQDPLLNRVCAALDGRVVDAAAVRPPRPGR
ncbi:MAG: hypothetical protein AB7D57_04490, partial [Desulfovibrionaceae bacterium]